MPSGVYRKTKEHRIKISRTQIGRIISKETRKKISNSLKGIKRGPQSERHKNKLSKVRKGINKGRIVSIETRKKISESGKGKIISIETRQRISKAKTGKKLSNGHKKNISLSAPCGINHHNWNNGSSLRGYCDVWIDKEYKQSIKERDRNKCLNPECNKKSDILHLHHINYNKKSCNPFNLITICNSCNSKANYNRDWHQSWYEAIIYRRYKINEM